MAQGTAARRAALETLKRVRAGQLFKTAHRAAVAGLTDSDTRLAHEIAAGVLRGRNSLDTQLRPLLSGRWRSVAPDLKDLLRIGVYQLTQLERVPTYAAVDTTVEAARQADGPRGAALVNAVLRRVAQSGGRRKQMRVSLTAADLAETHSHPDWLVARWVQNFGLKPTQALLEHNNRRPPLVIQPARWSLDRLRDRIVESGAKCSMAPFGEGLVVQGERVEKLTGYHEGAFIVQDAAQARLLRFAAVPEGARVWDACASPGGKAVMLSRRGPVVASEYRRDRFDRLRETLSRAAPEVPVLLADARFPPLSATKLDVTLIDAPCTATGALARHPDGRWRLSEERLMRAVESQGDLLDGACQAVRSGAELVYLTCSLEPEENGVQVDRFLERHPDFERIGEDLHVFPPDSGTDGGFAARMRRHT